MWFWVDFRGLGLGFVSKKTGKREERTLNLERERRMKNEANRVPNPFIHASGPGCPIPGPFPFNLER